ncbi:MAG: hypothetical protein ACO3AT_11360 [Ilumatobacteraceae bacterium]|jgi:hypothetical protein
MSSLLAIGWEPEIRGILTVIIGTVALCGSVYLLLGTNMGARLGFLVSMAGLFGWMMCMGVIWMIYGIGLVGNSPSWKPADPFSIVREGQYLLDAEVVDTPIKIDSDATFTEIADVSGAAMEAEGWNLLPADDRGRGQAIAAADEIIQIEAEMYAAGEYEATRVYVRGGERYPKIGDEFDFFAFFHKPSYAVVEIAPLIPQRTEPGRAPARPVIDESQPHQYVVMIRDLGTKRQPAAFITAGSTLIFLLCCWMMHRRDRIVAANRGLAIPAKV